jgi:hypothetical protein
MRYGTTLLTGYSAVVVVMLAVVVSAIGHQRELTIQQNRDMDAAIDQIVAKHQERKRLAALGLPTPAPVPAAPTQVASTARAIETTGAGTADAAETSRPSDAKSLTVLQSAKKPGGRRAGRRHDHFLPTALATLPRLTTYTLLGLR